MLGAKEGFGAGVACQFSASVALLSNGTTGVGRNPGPVGFRGAADDLEPLDGRQIQAAGYDQSAGCGRDSVIVAGNGVWGRPTPAVAA